MTVAREEAGREQAKGSGPVLSGYVDGIHDGMSDPRIISYLITQPDLSRNSFYHVTLHKGRKVFFVKGGITTLPLSKETW